MSDGLLSIIYAKHSTHQDFLLCETAYVFISVRQSHAVHVNLLLRATANCMWCLSMLRGLLSRKSNLPNFRSNIMSMMLLASPTFIKHCLRYALDALHSFCKRSMCAIVLSLDWVLYSFFFWHCLKIEKSIPKSVYQLSRVLSSENEVHWVGVLVNLFL